jgi:ankyrin repeat protein
VVGDFVPKTSSEMASLFLRKDADLEARSREGDTPLLILAGEPDREPAIEAVLDAGANVNATGREGETALDVALARDEEEKAALLQRYGGKTTRSL